MLLHRCTSNLKSVFMLYSVTAVKLLIYTQQLTLQQWKLT